MRNFPGLSRVEGSKHLNMQEPLHMGGTLAAFDAAQARKAAGYVVRSFSKHCRSRARWPSYDKTQATG